MAKAGTLYENTVVKKRSEKLGIFWGGRARAGLLPKGGATWEKGEGAWTRELNIKKVTKVMG